MSFVSFLHTYTGLGKSTFLKKLLTINPENYSITQSDVIKEMVANQHGHLPMSQQNSKARSIFNRKIISDPKISLADKNFIKFKDLKYIITKSGKNPIVLFAIDSFELPAIMLALTRVLQRSDHESLKVETKDQQIITLKVTLSFINLSLASFKSNPNISEYIPVNFFKNDIKNTNLEIGEYKDLLSECIKQASFSSINDDNPLFLELHRVLTENRVKLNEKINNHILSLQELDLEVLRIHELIQGITQKTSSESKQSSDHGVKPIYIGYFVNNDDLNKLLSAYGRNNEIDYPHVTMAYSEDKVKLFMLSEPTLKIRGKVNGILNTATHSALDIEFIDHPQPVKVAEKENPYHITIRSPPRKAFLSGILLDKYKKGLLKDAEYIPLDGPQILGFDLKVFNSDRTYVNVPPIDPEDPLKFLSSDNSQRLQLEEELRQIEELIGRLDSGEFDLETVDRIISDFKIEVAGKSSDKNKTLYKKTKHAKYGLMNVRKKIVINLKKISGGYSVENYPNHKYFQQIFPDILPPEIKDRIKEIINLGFNDFITSKVSEGKTFESITSEYQNLLSVSLSEIDSIKIMHPINFYNWSIALFNWLNGLSKGPLVKIHSETSPQDKNDVVGYGFKTDSRLDEKIYKENKELRMYLPRGIYFDSSKQLKNFAIRKFFGEGLDEDKEEGELQHQGQDQSNDLFGTTPTHFFATSKANGENSQVYVDEEFIFIGSKNRKIRLRRTNPLEDIELYKSNYLRTGNNTYFYAIGFADNLINKLIQTGKYDMFLDFLQFTRWTANFEFENVDTQHVVYLTETKSVLIGFSSPFIEGLTCHPFLSVLVGTACSLDVVGKNGDIRPISELDGYISEMRQRTNSEGDVILELDETGKVLSLVKKKTIWYILLRATREKLRLVLKQMSLGKLNLDSALELVTSAITTRLGVLFNEEFLRDVDNKSERTEEMVNFAKFIVNLYSTSGQTITKSYLSKYPLFYNMFKGIEGSDEEYAEFIRVNSGEDSNSKVSRKYSIKNSYFERYQKYKLKYMKLKNKLLKN